jgi:hypothetical protein
VIDCLRPAENGEGRDSIGRTLNGSAPTLLWRIVAPVGDAVEIHRSRDAVVSPIFPEGSRQIRSAKSTGPARHTAAVVSAAMAGEL